MKPDALLAFARADRRPRCRRAALARATLVAIARSITWSPAISARSRDLRGHAARRPRGPGAIDPRRAPAFMRVACRHFTTSWVARERAETRLAEPFAERDARLCLAYADAVLAARAAAN